MTNRQHMKHLKEKV